jgi:hypothetical protein
MGYNFNEYHVEQVYRMGRERSAADQGIIDRPRTVFIMFNMQSTRDLVIKRRYMLRNKRVYVSEFFPREIKEDRKRLYCIMKKACTLREYDRRIRLVANHIVLNGVSYGVNDFDSLPDNLHPKNICTERRDGVTFFFKCDSPLSNHHRCIITDGPDCYTSSEQMFFCKKAGICGDLGALTDIKASDNPKEQKRLGGMIKACNGWMEKRVDVMTTCCRAKFTQNPHLSQFLLETEDTLLCEDCPGDSFWGLGFNRNQAHTQGDLSLVRGNHMGKILSVIRQELHMESD